MFGVIAVVNVIDDGEVDRARLRLFVGCWCEYFDRCVYDRLEAVKVAQGAGSDNIGGVGDPIADDGQSCFEIG
ncbi:hypothetical protein D3C76_1305930 [compost metagenome]